MMPSVSEHMHYKLMQVLKAQVEGYEGLWCNIRDMYNYEKDRKEANRAHDAQMFIDNLQRKQEQGSAFYFAYEMDDDNRLKHVF